MVKSFLAGVFLLLVSQSGHLYAMNAGRLAPKYINRSSSNSDTARRDAEAIARRNDEYRAIFEEWIMEHNEEEVGKVLSQITAQSIGIPEALQAICKKKEIFPLTMELIRNIVSVGIEWGDDRNRFVKVLAEKGHFIMLKVLLSCSNFRAKNFDSRNKVVYSIERRILEFSKSRVPVAAVGETALHYASRTGDLEFVKLILKNNINLVFFNNNAYLDIPDGSNKTPLHHAVRLKYPYIVTALLQAGASVDPKDGEGKTPTALLLMANCYMCNAECKEILKMLIVSGCDLNQFKDILIEMIGDERQRISSHHGLRMIALFHLLGKQIKQRKGF